ncbi:MAG: methyltransferase domain-containing protein [Alphaproteobacteria bacterium]|nr:MAG: methyltransferase domain-containing protein [Alphaproteobacteria bacterium]
MSDVETPNDIYDPAFVKGVFDRCSTKYIFFSYVCSAGFTERWRRQCVAHLPEPETKTPLCYDLMAGTGEVWPHLLKQFPDVGSITAVDISSGMHQRAMKRLHQHRAHKIEFIEDDVLNSDLPSGAADIVLSTFGLKTFNTQQHRKLAHLIARLLKPGGTFSLIEASDPKGWWLAPLYRFHLTKFLPLVERVALRGAQDFSMIGTYCVQFSDCQKMMGYLAEAGLEVSYRKYFFGCATGVVGRKPTVQSVA